MSKRFYLRLGTLGIVIVVFLIAFIFLISANTSSKQIIKISKQDTYVAGKSGGCLISVSESRRGDAVAAAKIKLDLVDQKKKNVKTIYEGDCDKYGQAAVNFEVPKISSGDYYIKVNAASGFGRDKIYEKISVNNTDTAGNVTISLDKPLYKPGDEVNYRVLMTSSSNDKPMQKDMTVTIRDGKKNTVYKKNMAASEYGIAEGKFILADKVNSGAYQLKVESGTTFSEKEFEVKPYILPKFKVNVATGKKEYLVGEEVKGTLQAAYFFGQPVKNGKADVKVNGTTMQEVSLDEKGEGRFTFKIDGEGEKGIEVSVTDPSNYLEKGSTVIYTGKNLIRVEMIPESGKLIPGVQNEVYVFTTKLDGSPVKTYMKLEWGAVKEIATDSNGIARFTFSPEKISGEKVSVKALVSDESGKVKFTQYIDLPVSGNEYGVLVRPEKIIYEVNEKLPLDILSNYDINETRIYAVKDKQILKIVNTDKAHVVLDLPQNTYGLIDIYAEKKTNRNDPYNQRSGEKNFNVSRKTVFIKPDKKLNMEIIKEDKDFKPGEEVDVSFTVRDNKGRLLNSAIGVSILDEALLALKSEDFTLDNLKLSLSQIGADQTVHGVDLYTAILNNMHPGMLSAILMKGSSSNAFLRESQYDSSDKTEKRWEYFGLWLLVAAVLLIIWLFFMFKVFRMIVFYLTGFICAGLVVMLYTNPDEMVDALAVVVVIAFFCLLFIIKTKNKIKDMNVAALFALTLAPLFFVFVLTSSLLGHSIKRYDMSTNSMEHVGESAAATTGATQNASSGVDGVSISEDGTYKKVEKFYDESTQDVNKPGKTDVKKNDSQSTASKLRNRFVESLYFASQIIAREGKASLKIPLADNITTWKLRAVANSMDGYVGSKSDSIKVFKDFFIDFELPQNLTSGDQVSIPLTVYNYLKVPQNVTVKITDAEWFTLQDHMSERVVYVSANEQKLIYIPIKVSRTGKFKFRVDAQGQAVADAVEKDINIYAAGYKVESISATGKVNQSAAEKVIFMDKDMEGTRKIRVKLYPSGMAQVVEGLENILRMPSGCFEQTSSSLYPDILVLKYLKNTKMTNQDIEAKANQYIEKGFQKLLTYEVSGESGGFSLFGDPPAETVLTAYGLMEFNDLKEVYPVEDSLLQRTKEFLFSKQKGNGTFEITGYHTEGIELSDTVAMNAYIGWALSEVCKGDPRFKKTLEFLKSEEKAVQDNYTLALMANALVNTNDKDTGSLLKRMVESAVMDGDKAYLKTNGMDYFGACGSTQNLQATALASIALSKANMFSDTNKKFLNYIASQKDSYGNYGSTQSTILALKALVASTKAGELKDDKIKIRVNNVEKTVEVKAGNTLDYYQKEFSVSDVENNVRIQTINAINYEIIKEYYVPYESGESGDAFDIRREMDSQLNVNEETVEKIRIANARHIPVKNLLVSVQIPQGFTVDSPSLDLMKKKSEIQEYELGYDTLNIYISDFEASEVKNLDIKMRPRYPAEILSGAVRVYDYYNTEVESKLKPVNIIVDR